MSVKRPASPNTPDSRLAKRTVSFESPLFGHSPSSELRRGSAQQRPVGSLSSPAPRQDDSLCSLITKLCNVAGAEVQLRIRKTTAAKRLEEIEHIFRPGTTSGVPAIDDRESRIVETERKKHAVLKMEHDKIITQHQSLVQQLSDVCQKSLAQPVLNDRLTDLTNLSARLEKQHLEWKAALLKQQSEWKEALLSQQSEHRDELNKLREEHKDDLIDYQSHFEIKMREANAQIIKFEILISHTKTLAESQSTITSRLSSEVHALRSSLHDLQWTLETTREAVRALSLKNSTFEEQLKISDADATVNFEATCRRLKQNITGVTNVEVHLSMLDEKLSKLDAQPKDDHSQHRINARLIPLEAASADLHGLREELQHKSTHQDSQMLTDRLEALEAKFDTDIQQLKKDSIKSVVVVSQEAAMANTKVAADLQKQQTKISELSNPMNPNATGSMMVSVASDIMGTVRHAQSGAPELAGRVQQHDKALAEFHRRQPEVQAAATQIAASYPLPDCIPLQNSLQKAPDTIGLLTHRVKALEENGCLLLHEHQSLRCAGQLINEELARIDKWFVGEVNAHSGIKPTLEELRKWVNSREDSIRVARNNIEQLQHDLQQAQTEKAGLISHISSLQASIGALERDVRTNHNGTSDSIMRLEDRMNRLVRSVHSSGSQIKGLVQLKTAQQVTPSGITPELAFQSYSSTCPVTPTQTPSPVVHEGQVDIAAQAKDVFAPIATSRVVNAATGSSGQVSTVQRTPQPQKNKRLKSQNC